MLVAGWNSIRHEDLHTRALIHTKAQPWTCWKVHGTSDSLSLASPWPRGAVARRVRSSSHLWFMNIDWSGLCGTFSSPLRLSHCRSSPANHHLAHTETARDPSPRSRYNVPVRFPGSKHADSGGPHLSLSTKYTNFLVLPDEASHSSVCGTRGPLPQPSHKLRPVLAHVSYEQAGFFHSC